MSKQEEAGLILKLYELRRDETMRKARDWFFVEFHPESLEDVNKAMFSEKSNYMRMVTSYWEMAAALVNHEAISLDLFNDTNGEHLTVFAKLEPMLTELRATYGPHFMASLEKLIEKTPGGRERLALVRQRIPALRPQFEARRAQSAQQS